MRNGPSSTVGGGTCATTSSNSEVTSLFGPFGIGGHPAVAARAVEHREVELLVGGVERGEQVEDLVEHRLVALVGAVDLVDDDDRPQALLQRLGDHELGLRHRAFGGVDQHDGAVHHVEDALHLAAEIGVAGRVDDVDARALPEDGGALGQDGDAALALQVVAVHRLGFHLLVLAEGAGLLQAARRPAWSCRDRRGR